MSIAENLVALRAEIARIAAGAGRSPEELKVIAVSKTVGPDRILEAYHAGQRCFGENRVQEWLEKSGQLPSDIEWHLIGHLQTNKVKSIAGRTELIHSVDSIRLAEEIEKRAAAGGKKICVLAEVKTSEEATKGGLLPSELPEFLKAVSGFRWLEVQGLMTVGPLTDDREKVRAAFRGLRLLAEEWRTKGFPGLKYLSMGMSDDYPVAIEEGAHFIRVGRAIFGERAKNP